MNFAAKTDKSLKRANNEDFYYVNENLFIIADGMGGHNAGEVASRIAVETARDMLCGIKEDYEGKICEAIEAANKAVHEKADGEKAGMGTTLDICVFDENKLYIGHVGDSRVYVIHKSSLRRVTQDHSYVEMLLKKGEITEEEAHNYPMKNMITRAVGINESVKCDFYEVEIKEGEKLLLCTDGLTNMVDDETIGEISGKETPERAVELLVDKANGAGGKDNITVIIAENKRN